MSKKARAAIFATAKLTSLSKSSINTALKIVDLALAPIASYGIQNEEEADVHNITQMKFQDYWKNDVEAWFERVNAFFTIIKRTRRASPGPSNTCQRTCLSRRAIFSVMHQKTTSTASSGKRFSSDSALLKIKNYKQLLAKEEIGDEKPSVSLRKLQHLAGKDGTDDMVRKIWMVQLPDRIRKLLAAHGDRTLDRQAEIANYIQNVIGKRRSTFSATASLERDDSQEDFCRKIEKNQCDFQTMMYGMLESIQDLALSMKKRGRSPIRRSNHSDDKDGKKENYQRKQSCSKSRHRFNKDLPLPRHIRRQRTQRRGWLPLQAAGKLEQQVAEADNTCYSKSNRLFVRDVNTNLEFLVDTGSDVCVFPRKLLKSTGALAKTYLDLTAANGKPIIGMDLLHHFDLPIVDPKRRKLIDGLTKLSVSGVSSRCAWPSVKTVSGSGPFLDILKKFPNLTRLQDKVIKHDTMHHIKTTDGPPAFTRPRRLDPEREAAAKARFMSYIKSGKMRPSSSQWASALHTVKKNDSSWRDCGDYRMLNARTMPDRYPILNIQDATVKLSGCTIFSVLDLPKAFYHIPVNPPDIPKTAITTPFGLYEFIYMPFGLRNASQTFQRFINEVTRELPFVFVYIDDILVFSRDPEEHAEHLRILFERLDSYGLVLNTYKCVFGASEVNFLGCRISSDGALPLNKHVDTILAFPQPENMGQLRRFLGLLNFYHRWLPNIALDQVPLNHILSIPGLKKQSKIEFNKDAVAAFNTCKQKLAAATKLAQPNPNCPLSIVTDASDFGMGGVLQQKVEGVWQPLGFFSKKEEGKNQSPRQIQHLDFISQFSMDIRFVPGKDNLVADALSRIEIEAVEKLPVNFGNLAQSQNEDPELQELLKGGTAPQLQPVPIPNTNLIIISDSSTGRARPFLTLNPHLEGSSTELINLLIQHETRH
ncbi:Hypothetical predicted protein [Cloeon dipterum]|uniref:Reverse transcriptase domain-containing protein n=1 Tax=Cloeon dipterum TaxID=197152 RepID=A0A8S1D278_9INSE|nr:Hypothetical predicted protein [Cloeon dipterum]